MGINNKWVYDTCKTNFLYTNSVKHFRTEDEIMNCTKKVLLVLLPILILGCLFSTTISYGDVKVNITEEKTEPYSNKKDSDTVIINNDETTPLNDNSKEEVMIAILNKIF